MNVLWLTFGLPYPADAGSRIRDFHLLREAARTSRVHLFSLLPPGGPADVGQLRDFCQSIETFALPGSLSGRQLGSFIRSGCAGLEVCHGVHLLVADDPRQFADGVVQLLGNDARRAEPAGNARRLVEQRYDWPMLGRRLALAHREILASSVVS